MNLTTVLARAPPPEIIVMSPSSFQEPDLGFKVACPVRMKVAVLTTPVLMSVNVETTFML